MQVGLIGTGNMARALARGWGRPVVCSDPDVASAQALVEAVGGEVLASNAEVARTADVVVLCHKPAQLESVAREVAPHASLVASILGGVELERLRAAYPASEVHRLMPSTPVALGQGVVLFADGGGARRDDVAGLFAELGRLIVLPEAQIDAGMHLMSCGPAYVALVAEAQIDAGVRRGLTPALATEMVVQTLTGTAALLRENDGDTLAVRRAVTSPGGSTARGLAALERGGLRAAFDDAIDSVLDG